MIRTTITPLAWTITGKKAITVRYNNGIPMMKTVEIKTVTPTGQVVITDGTRFKQTNFLKLTLTEVGSNWRSSRELIALDDPRIVVWEAAVEAADLSSGATKHATAFIEAPGIMSARAAIQALQDFIDSQR